MKFERRCGILLHPTSLPSRFGIGDFGEEALRFIDFLIDSGQTYWQILPLSPPDFANSPYESLVKNRYKSFDSGKGKDFENGKLKLTDLYNMAKSNGELELQSGKQELFENIINQYI